MGVTFYFFVFLAAFVLPVPFISSKYPTLTNVCIGVATGLFAAIAYGWIEDRRVADFHDAQLDSIYAQTIQTVSNARADMEKFRREKNLDKRAVSDFAITLKRDLENLNRHFSKWEIDNRVIHSGKEADEAAALREIFAQWRPSVLDDIIKTASVE